MADNVTTPQMDFPPRFHIDDDGNVDVAVVEQDSLSDIRNCLQVILRTPIDSREELPEFGVEDPTFRQQPLDPTGLENALNEWEPRANVTVHSFPDANDEAIAHLRIEYEGPEGSIEVATLDLTDPDTDEELTLLSYPDAEFFPSDDTFPGNL